MDDDMFWILLLLSTSSVNPETGVTTQRLFSFCSDRTDFLTYETSSTEKKYAVSFIHN